MPETRPNGAERASAGTVGAPARDDPRLDDWLGDVSDDDWSEQGTERAQRERSAASLDDRFADDVGPEPWAEPPTPSRPAATAEAERTVGRRRLVAVLVLLGIIGVAVAIPAVLLRNGADDETPTSTLAPPTTSTPTETTTTPETTTPAETTPEATTPETTTPTEQVTGFALPEGTTKLTRGDDNPEAITDLQQALTAAGYDPGTPDGKFGEQTEQAVKAFQEANGLTADGVVGAETAAALNTALASG